MMDRVLDPISRCFTHEAATALVRLRADAEMQRRIDELADKCNEGHLSAEERAEYEAYVWAADLIAILQSKARVYLAKSKRRVMDAALATTGVR